MEVEKQELDIKEIFEVLKKKWKPIFLASTIFFMFSIFYSLSLTNIYTSSSVVVLSQDNDSGNLPGIYSNYSSLAGSFGIDVPNFSKGKNSYVVETRLKSKDFFKHLLNIENTMLNLMAAQAYNYEEGKFIYDGDIFDSKTKKWVDGAPSFMDAYRFFNSSLYINNDKIKGYMVLSFDHKSPKFSADFLDLIVKEYNELSRDNDLQESKKALEYLKLKMSLENSLEIKETISELMQNQIEVQMLAEIRQGYILDFADKPFIPDIKSYPRRSLIVISLTAIGLLLTSIFFLTIHFYYRKII